MRAVVSALLLAAVAGAQKTWIVDASNGQGTHFTKIQLAINAASAGDNIVVRKGGYSAFSVAKGVKILAEPGVDVAIVWTGSQYTKITVSSIPLGQTCVLRGFRVWSNFTQRRWLDVVNCKGNVQLESLNLDSKSPSSEWALDLQGSRAVTLRACRVRNGVRIENSTVTASSCEFIDGGSLLPPGPAVIVKSSKLTLASCRADGGWFPNFNGFPAIDAHLSNVRILGDASSVYRAGFNVPGGVPAIAGDPKSLLWIDPRVTIVPWGRAAKIVGFAKVVSRRAPFLEVAREAALGSVAEVEQHGASRDVYGLFLSLPAVPQTTPIGDLWLDARLAILFGVGVHGSTGISKTRLAIPRVSSLRGLPIAWQGIGGPANARSWTNVVVTTLH